MHINFGYQNAQNATLMDLKHRLQSAELCVDPERQRLFFMGYEITDDNLKLNDIVTKFGCNDFSVVLPRAQIGHISPLPGPEQRFLITGTFHKILE